MVEDDLKQPQPNKTLTHPPLGCCGRHHYLHKSTWEHIHQNIPRDQQWWWIWKKNSEIWSHNFIHICSPLLNKSFLVLITPSILLNQIKEIRGKHQLHGVKSGRHKFNYLSKLIYLSKSGRRFNITDFAVCTSRV